MGTRHLIIIKLNGKNKLAQYGQWDGYLNGQGADIAKFLQSKKFDFEKFKANVQALEWATDKEIKDSWTECGADPNSDLVSFDIADKHTARYPELSRDTGAKVLPLIQAGKVKKVQNSIDFLKDSLFCEWAYEIDLSKKTVSVYQGFQATGKMETAKRADGSTYKREKYAPCKKVKTYKIADFTVKALKELDKKLNPKDDE